MSLNRHYCLDSMERDQKDGLSVAKESGQEVLNERSEFSNLTPNPSPSAFYNFSVLINFCFFPRGRYARFCAKRADFIMICHAECAL